MRGTRSNRGFTVVEILVALVVLASNLWLITQGFRTSSGLSAQARVGLRAAEESRRNLMSVADELRSAALASLTGFDADGEATSVGFARVLGVNGDTPVLDAAQQLSWRSSGAAIDGVRYPGQLVAVSGGVTRVLCARVPQGGFRVRREGRALRIWLTTYYTTSQGMATTREDSTTVTLRN